MPLSKIGSRHPAKKNLMHTMCILSEKGQVHAFL